MERVTVRVTQSAGRLGGLVAVAAAVVMLAACGNDGVGAAGPPEVSGPADASAHTGHGAGAIPVVAPLRAGERFSTLRLPEPYKPTAPDGGTDEYRCFLVDPKLTSAAYLTGSQFQPQNTAIDHHAVVFRVDPELVAKAHSVDAADPGQGWRCFGDAGIGGDPSWVANWAHGENEVLLPPTVGYPMAPGSQLVIQVHYNLLATGGKPGPTDQSGIRLRLTDGTRKLDPLEVLQLPAPIELPCAAGESGPLCDRTTAMADVTKRFGKEVGVIESLLVKGCGNGTPVPGTTQHCDHPIRQDGTLYAVHGHMHLLGRSIKIELNPGRKDARTLLNEQVFDFDNQALYPLGKPLDLKAGDTLRVTCTHDAGLRKQLPQLRSLPPRYVVWGDGTADEMCLGLAIWSPKPVKG
jgi:Copper type II ascorbate-dependent monooxygenase, C-terminal domain